MRRSGGWAAARLMALAAVAAGVLCLLPGRAAQAAGPEELKVLGFPGKVIVAFPTAPSVTFTVYRHAYEQERTMVVVGWVRTDAAGRIVPGSDAPAGAWRDDDPVLANMLVFTDSDVQDYKEYYYLVSDGRFAGDYTDHVVAAAFPPTPSRHGNFIETTNSCTACHGLHSSNHKKLLKGATIRDLCVTCHNGTGSKYDVVNGYVRLSSTWASRVASPSGAFGQFVWSQATVESSSAHNVDAGLEVRQAPGSGLAPDTKTWNSHFTCTSCHDPHNLWQNYRSLRGVMHGRQVKVRGFTAVSWTAPDQADARTVVEHVYGMNDFCGSCHVYFNDPRPGGVYKGQAGVAGSHRHPVGISPASYADVRYDIMSWEYDQTGLAFEDARPLTTTLPLEGTHTGAQYNQNVMTCLTCHNAHGTTYSGKISVAYVNGAANGTEGAAVDATGYTPRDAALAGRVGSTVLKRLPNMAVCQDCHQK